MTGIDQMTFRGKAPWMLHRDYADHECMKPAANYTPDRVPKPGGKLTFD